jgi:hypothetical protein
MMGKLEMPWLSEFVVVVEIVQMNVWPPESRRSLTTWKWVMVMMAQ